jgi:hypothetical protein
MITKISKEGWEAAYYGRWLRLQRAARRKDKKVCRNILKSTLCDYCREQSLSACFNRCSLRSVCANYYGNIKGFIYKSLTPWVKINPMIDQIVEAIRQDGVEWGYIDG